MISIGVPLFLIGGLLGYWIFRKKDVLVRVIAGFACGCFVVGILVIAVVLGGDH